MRSSYIPAERRERGRRRRREKKERERASIPGRAPFLLKNCRKKSDSAKKAVFHKKKGNVEERVGAEEGKSEEEEGEKDRDQLRSVLDACAITSTYDRKPTRIHKR